MEAAAVAGFAMFGVMMLVGVGLFAFWIWSIVDVVKVPSDDRFRAGNQLTWILVVVLAQVIGSIIYVAVGRPPPGLRR